jgi:hypothetical protein
MRYWVLFFFSPKGWDSLAQGNALGTEAIGMCSLKGCDTPSYPRPSACKTNTPDTQGVALG